MTNDRKDAVRKADGSRGRHASRPGKIPPKGWKDVLLRVKEEIGNDNLNIVAAGIAFYVLLSLFPALAAAVAIYGLVADPVQVQQAIDGMAGVLPPSAVGLIDEQLTGIVESAPESLGLGAVVSILLALWSASKGTKALIGGVNLAYDEEETRGFVKLQGTSLLMTVGIIVGGVVSIGLITVVPHLFDRLELGVAGAAVLFILQWIVLFALIQLGLNAIYRFAPDRADPQWRWLTLGTFVIGGLWIAVSALFSWYAASFGSFNETYGTIAGVIVLLLWLQITFFLILIGAELNSELEHQTRLDTTTGEPEPMGERGAVMADTLGEPMGD